MKKVIGLVAAMALAVPATVSAAEIVRVDDPTGSAFSSDSHPGYVAVYTDGVVACNTNPDYTRPDNGEPLTGYIWVGSAHAASDPAGQSPGGHVGAGNNTAEDNPETTDVDESHGPCEDK